jgi:hypothetical protein
VLSGNVKKAVTNKKENNQYGEKGIIKDNSRQGED